MGTRKKTGSNARRDAAIKEIQKVRKGKPSARPAPAAEGGEAPSERAATSESAAAVGSAVAISWLQQTRERARAESEAIRARHGVRTAAADAHANGVPAPAAEEGQRPEQTYE